MIRIFASWIENRRQIRRQWHKDACALIEQHGREAYYEAQRLASRSRAQADRSRFWHWAKVASEVARLSPVVQMNIEVVQAITDDEMRKHRRF